MAGDIEGLTVDQQFTVSNRGINRARHAFEDTTRLLMNDMADALVDSGPTTSRRQFHLAMGVEGTPLDGAKKRARSLDYLNLERTFGMFAAHTAFASLSDLDGTSGPTTVHMLQGRQQALMDREPGESVLPSAVRYVVRLDESGARYIGSVLVSTFAVVGFGNADALDATGAEIDVDASQFVALNVERDRTSFASAITHQDTPVFGRSIIRWAEKLPDTERYARELQYFANVDDALRRTVLEDELRSPETPTS